MTSEAKIGKRPFPSCVSSYSGELTCPRGDLSEKRFLLSQLPCYSTEMTPLRGALWNAIAILLKEALASAEIYAPKGAGPSPRLETPTQRHPPMRAQLTPHLGLG